LCVFLPKQLEVLYHMHHKLHRSSLTLMVTYGKYSIEQATKYLDLQSCKFDSEVYWTFTRQILLLKSCCYSKW